MDKRNSECPHVQMIWEQTGEINDLDLLFEGKRGALWGLRRPLSLETRQAARRAKKWPRI
jgi:hypothetical protein